MSHILVHAGTHPFLLELVCFSLCEQLQRGSMETFGTAYSRVRAQCEAVFRTYKVGLREELGDGFDELDALIQNGADFSTFSDPEKLVALGVARWNDASDLLPLSEMFLSYWAS